ncbi:Uu.00g135820.m01.CDS01 [Anthostomella pinea]|uniref:Uu.00g135820.m01.CDS01 n=1 Tax=Anthostomella pinea TaxID=933095 RepID=A0AAI8VP86_9PEZI|nr:Uu.00g135820.m01.CDS01 [Anthostomella pinea]
MAINRQFDGPASYAAPYPEEQADMDPDSGIRDRSKTEQLDGGDRVSAAGDTEMSDDEDQDPNTTGGLLDGRFPLVPGGGTYIQVPIYLNHIVDDSREAWLIAIRCAADAVWSTIRDVLATGIDVDSRLAELEPIRLLMLNFQLLNLAQRLQYQKISSRISLLGHKLISKHHAGTNGVSDALFAFIKKANLDESIKDAYPPVWAEMVETHRQRRQGTGIASSSTPQQ